MLTRTPATLFAGLAPSVATVLLQRAEKLRLGTAKSYPPLGGIPVARVLTDELLVAALVALEADVAAAVPTPDRVVQYRLLAWLVASALASPTAPEGSEAVKVGKRLEKQAKNVRRQLAAVVSAAEQAGAAARAADGDATQDLAAIDERELWVSSRGCATRSTSAIPSCPSCPSTP